ncbi:hypothetical protein [Streptomyces puniciscabiei]|uniref:hypothetical protein n=1 Tax=Streptomyces puniciscabiei TaxID=164348 RepID=UPI003798A085
MSRSRPGSPPPAYQISDDVADLYGMSAPDDYRQGIFARAPARDLVNGTVPCPVAQALALLDLADRRRLAAALHARTEADHDVTKHQSARH